MLKQNKKPSKPVKDKKPVGAPRKYTEADKVKELIDSYFLTKCQDEPMKDTKGHALVDSKGRPIIKYNPPTIAGLSAHLGFASRQSLYEYMNTVEFGDTIKRAIQTIEEYAEKQLFIGNPTGAIFWLKNRGENWRDKSEVGISGKINSDDADELEQIILNGTNKKKTSRD